MAKAKILLIPDVPGWCFCRCANQIIKHLSHRYEFTKIYNYKSIGKDMLPPIDDTPYDLVFRFIAYRMPTTASVHKFKLLTSIRSQSSVERRPEDFTSEVMCNTYNCISVVAKNLRDLMPKKCCPIFDTPNGVDTELFIPIPHAHPFTIGFAGNSKHPNSKGMDLILKAAELANVKCKIADRNECWIPHEQMPNFYKEIDVYCCMSTSEGMPNTVLEAASMGKPTIATNVNGVPEIITSGKTGLLIERNVPALVEAIQTLKRDKELYTHMSINNRNNVLENWQWKNVIKNYDTFFNFALSVIPERFMQ